MTVPSTALKQVSLHSTLNGADKVYHLWIEPDGALFAVRAVNGRRGGTLTNQEKAIGVDEAMAEKTFATVLKKKLAEGYTRLGDVAIPTLATAAAGLEPIPLMLLTDLNEDDVNPYLHHDQWVAQEKFDGKRMLLRREGSVVLAQNRLMKSCDFHPAWIPAMQALPDGLALDGEQIGERFFVFDVLRYAGKDVRRELLSTRLDLLQDLFDDLSPGPLTAAATMRTTDTKVSLYHTLKEQKAEGLVIKRVTAPYGAGRALHALKIKFWAEASCLVVRQVPGKRSVQLGLYHEDTLLELSKCTIPANYAIPKPGAIVNVRYLYAFPGTHALFQAQYEGERDDLRPEECVLGQLKYKRTEE